jgi:hypothetical protein
MPDYKTYKQGCFLAVQTGFKVKNIVLFTLKAQIKTTEIW